MLFSPAFDIKNLYLKTLLGRTVQKYCQVRDLKSLLARQC